MWKHWQKPEHNKAESSCTAFLLGTQSNHKVFHHTNRLKWLSSLLNDFKMIFGQPNNGLIGYIYIKMLKIIHVWTESYDWLSFILRVQPEHFFTLQELASKSGYPLMWSRQNTMTYWIQLGTYTPSAPHRCSCQTVHARPCYALDSIKKRERKSRVSFRLLHGLSPVTRTHVGNYSEPCTWNFPTVTTNMENTPHPPPLFPYIYLIHPLPLSLPPWCSIINLPNNP